jgi:hypothetical protein
VDPEKEGSKNHVLKRWFHSLEGRRHFLKLGSRSWRKKYIDFMDNKKLEDVLKSFGRKKSWLWIQIRIQNKLWISFMKRGGK